MVPLGVSSAGAVRVGERWAGATPRRQAGRGDGGLLGVGFMAIAALTLLLVPRAIIGAFTGDVAVVAMGTPLLLVAAMFQLFDGLQVGHHGNPRGAGDTRTAMTFNFVAYWGLGLPIAAGLGFGGRLGRCRSLARPCAGLVVLGLALLTVWIAKVLALLAHPQPD